MSYHRRMLHTPLTRRCTIGIIVVQSCLIFYLQHSLRLIVQHSAGEADARGVHAHEPIDVVYTWVNGSEERFLEQLRRSGARRAGGVKEDIDGARRFADKSELLYSLRSIEKHMPWIRHVYVVTNGQVPAWLDVHSGHASVVPHAAIFPDARHLPTFSSPAIEANLHRIPGISQRFLYLNDDWLIGAPVEYSTFYTPTDGQLFYWEFMLPPCAHECPWSQVANGRCDVACYVPECQMDGGDCRQPPALHEYLVLQWRRRLVESAYGQSLQTTQRLLNARFGHSARYVMPHLPALVDVAVMRDAWRDFPAELGNTSARRYRDGADLQFEFFYAFYAQEKSVGTSLAEALRAHDTDGDGLLTAGDLQTMMIRHSTGAGDPQKFSAALRACLPEAVRNASASGVRVSLLEGCALLGDVLETTLRRRSKYKTLLMGKVPVGRFYHFGGLQSDLRGVRDQLNQLRRQPPKFICLNDDLTHNAYTKNVNRQIYEELARFYQSMFPKPSKYELPEGRVNPPGKYIHELRAQAAARGDSKRKLKKHFAWLQYGVVVACVGILLFLACAYRRRRHQYQETMCGTRNVSNFFAAPRHIGNVKRNGFFVFPHYRMK